MAHTGKIYPDTGKWTSPPPAGSYYNVKEQNLPAPATYRRSGRGRNAFCCLLACLFSVFVILGILFGIAIMIFWLVVQPRAPNFEIDNVHIAGLNTTVTSNIDTNVTYRITAHNPNKHVGIYYDDIHVSLEANGASIGEGFVPPFYQGHKNTTYLNGEISAQGVTLDSATVILLTASPTNVPLYAQVDVKARIKVGSMKSSEIGVKVRCDINVDLTKTGPQSQLNSKHCVVTW